MPGAEELSFSGSPRTPCTYRHWHGISVTRQTATKGHMGSGVREAVCDAHGIKEKVWNSSYHDIEGGDHVEGGGKYGTHGLHRWLIQAVIGR